MGKSIHDYEVYEYLGLKNPQYLDWEITLIFYSACKFLDAEILKNGKKKPSNHVQRNRLVKTEFPAIYNQYSMLYKLSIVSRYVRDVEPGDKSDALKWYRAIKSNFAQDESG